MGKSVLKLIGIIAVIAITAYVAIYGINVDGRLSYNNIRLGLDLQGGVNIVYEADVADPTLDEMSAAVQMIQLRLDRGNYTEAEVAIEGTNRIRVNIPGVDDPQEAIANIGATALLTFEDEEGNVVVEGKNVARAIGQLADTGFGQEAIVSLDFDSVGREAFRIATQENIGKSIVIRLDGQIISAPVVNDVIWDGSAMISGSFTLDSAKELAHTIEAGALPFGLIPVSSTAVGAKLGMDAFNSSVQAGTVGFCIILVFMLLVYRVSGLAADIALVFYVSLLIVTLSLIESTLTLPGIAGIILSIGMAVDANVIIFTRIKEEIIAGKSVRSAVDSGFNKALSAIVDGNATTLIASVVLYILGTGIIKSFATTLGIGLLVSMFTALVVTRLLLRTFVELGLNSPTMYGAKATKAGGAS
ncbi:MAG: protein-export membrane protein SecD [Epulopiscium sp. Nele67-Bin004]|nr:MAG: protein-export membrane protein SecD [Epulopiscium sp. Nele67-Bin004]